MKGNGCCERTVRSIKRQKSQILELSRTSSTSLNTKTLRASRFPIIEEKLLDFMTIARSARMPVTSSVLQMKAVMLRDLCLQNKNSEGETKKAIENFSASDGWVAAFVRRNAQSSVSLHGEGGSVNVVEVANKIAEIRRKLAPYSLEHIYNVDETGLFSSCFPEKRIFRSMRTAKHCEGRRT